MKHFDVSLFITVFWRKNMRIMLTCFNKSEGSTESQVVIKIWHKKAKMYKRIINCNIKNKKVNFLENTCSSAIFELRKLESVIFVVFIVLTIYKKRETTDFLINQTKAFHCACFFWLKIQNLINLPKSENMCNTNLIILHWWTLKL